MEKRFKKVDNINLKLIVLTILSMLLLVLIIYLSSNIIQSRKMVNAQVKQVLALQTIIENEPEENIILNMISETIIVETDKKEEEKVVTYGNKKIEIPKVKVAQVNDKEDIQNKVTDNSTSSAKAEKVTAQEAIQKFENSGTSVGIDVSKWQGYIDWKKVKNSGIEFAMIRIGYRGSSVGNIVMDPYFEQNIKGALSNGIYVGIYFFSMATTEEEAIQEAAWTVDIIKKYNIVNPVAYDFESFGQGRVANVSNEQINKNAVAFLNYIKSNGYDAMMYGSKNAFNTKWTMSKFSNFKIWLAHYTENTDYTGRYNMWQYTSKGSVNGINGNVDMNIAYFKYSDKKEEIKDEIKDEIIWDTND